MAAAIASTTDSAHPTIASTSVGTRWPTAASRKSHSALEDARRRRQHDRVDPGQADVALPGEDDDRGQGDRRPQRPRPGRSSRQEVVREQRRVVGRRRPAACRPRRPAGPARTGSPSSPATGRGSGDPPPRPRRGGSRPRRGTAGSRAGGPGCRRRRPGSRRSSSAAAPSGSSAASSKPRTVAATKARARSGSAASQSAVAGEDDLVEVREAVVGEGEGAQLDPALLRLDALPGRERDHEVGALGVERLVRGGVEGDGLERRRCRRRPR